MVTKFISLVVAVCVAELFIFGIQSPNDPLFWFISNNKIVVLLRLALVLGVLYVVFRNHFVYKLGRLFTGGLAAFLVLFGLMGISSQTVFNEFGGFIKVFDFWLAIEMGIVLSIAAISFEGGHRRLMIRELLRSRVSQPTLVKLGAGPTSLKAARKT